MLCGVNLHFRNGKTVTRNLKIVAQDSHDLEHHLSNKGFHFRLPCVQVKDLRKQSLSKNKPASGGNFQDGSRSFWWPWRLGRVHVRTAC